MHHASIARAIDIGFGYTKLSQSMIDENYKMSSMAFPSFPAPIGGNTDISDGLLKGLRVVAVEVDRVRYLVGPDSMSAASGRQTRAVTNLFFDSPQYFALYLGALAYINLPASADTIHALGMGLPLTVWRDAALRDRIKMKMTGTFKVPVPGSQETREIRVEEVRLWPQVIGALVSIAFERGELESVSQQDNLVIDVGYGTMLWIVTHGMKPQTGRSDGINGGVSSMLKAVAKMLDPSIANDPRALDRIDVSLRTGQPLILDGAEVDLQRCIDRAESQALQHVNDLLESIGTHKNLDNIYLAGGGAHLYAPLLTKAFGGRKIQVQVEEPQFANLKGYQQLVERLLER